MATVRTQSTSMGKLLLVRKNYFVDRRKKILLYTGQDDLDLYIFLSRRLSIKSSQEREVDYQVDISIFHGIFIQINFLQTVSQIAFVLKLLPFPLQPPYLMLSHLPLKVHLGYNLLVTHIEFSACFVT